MDAVRSLIQGIVQDRGINLSDLSKGLGRNHAYLQQYLKRGIPAKLPEDVRAKLAELLGIDETLLGGPLRTRELPQASSMDSAPGIPEYDIRGGASYAGGMIDADWNTPAGGSAGGTENGHEVVARWGLPAAFVRNELGLSFASADIIKVSGDSMDDGTVSSLRSGDRVIIDRNDKDPSQGGIFAVWDGNSVIIKQVELMRGNDPPQIICKSRNERFDPFSLVLDGSVHIIGRVAAKIARM